MRTLTLILVLAAAASGDRLHAQSGGGFELKWSTIDGGGGTSTGGVFSVSGTIGQPDAGTATGAGYQLRSGYWGVIQTSGAPLLRITRSGGNVILSWPNPSTTFHLQQTSTLPGLPAAWTDVASLPVVAGPNLQVTLPAGPGNRFFRLKSP
jgi:hypothetical protein